MLLNVHGNKLLVNVEYVSPNLKYYWEKKNMTRYLLAISFLKTDL